MGYYFAYGRDRSMRPVIYFDGRVYLDSKIPLDEMFNTVDLVLSYVIYNALIPGKIENYHCIIDVGNIGWGEFPFSDFAKISNHIRDGYFSKSASLTFVNVPMLVQIASKFLFTLVDEF